MKKLKLILISLSLFIPSLSFAEDGGGPVGDDQWVIQFPTKTADADTANKPKEMAYATNADTAEKPKEEAYANTTPGAKQDNGDDTDIVNHGDGTYDVNLTGARETGGRTGGRAEFQDLAIEKSKGNENGPSKIERAVEPAVAVQKTESSTEAKGEYRDDFGS